ncbi:MAG: helix-turn-helix domain-containing protein [Anaeroplasma bactoclasticum]|nr:helix-turn-helix domain-containing protein [Anaeroplasma bactoclasticum]
MNRLKQLRLEKKMTIKELGNVASMTDANISMIENGRRSLTENNAKFFADFFNVSIDYLLGTSDIRIKEKSPSIDDIELAFYNQHGIVTEAQKKEVESFIKYIRSKDENN